MLKFILQTSVLKKPSASVIRTCATEKCRQLRILAVLALYDVRKFRKRGRKKWKRNKILLFSSECAVEARKQEFLQLMKY